jgi:hypothetical protein
MSSKFDAAFWPIPLVIAYVAIGCSSSSEGSAPEGGTGDCGSAAVSLKSDVMPIFAENCSASGICHGQMHNSGEENLYLGLSDSGGANGPSDVAAVYASLVGVKSLEDPSMDLVTAGDLENSYLWHKVTGDQNSDSAVANGCQAAATVSNACSDCVPGAPCGVQMPFAGALEPAASCAIQNWIAQGAMDN